MKQFTKEEYIQLLEELVKQQYNSEEVENTEEIAWAPAEPESKKKILTNPGSIDLSLTKKDKLKELILNNKNIIIGSFRVRISRTPLTNSQDLLFSVNVYEENKSTKIMHKINVLTDNRFENREWKKYFNSFKSGSGIPEDILVDIIRWLQAIYRLAAFL